MDKFTQSMSGLLPQGYAWPRDVNSVLMSVVEGMAVALAQHHEDMHAVVEQWMPHRTVARLAEWEASTGLPDPCFGAIQTEEQRHKLLLLRLRPPDLPYEDSSPAAPGVIEDMCAELGYPGVAVSYNVPFRVGRNRVGDRLGALDGVLHVRVPTVSTPFRVGVGRVGDRLIERVGIGPELPCYLDRELPARFQINVIYE